MCSSGYKLIFLVLLGVICSVTAKYFSTSDCNPNSIGHVGNIKLNSAYPVDISKPISGSVEVNLAAGHPSIKGSKLVIQNLSRKLLFAHVPLCKNGKAIIGSASCELDFCKLVGENHCEALEDPQVTFYRLEESKQIPMNGFFALAASGTYNVEAKVVTADGQAELGCLQIKDIEIKKQ